MLYGFKWRIFFALMSPNLLAFFDVLYQKFCVFIIFICCIDEVPNFRKRILTNQKSELGIRD